MVHVRDFCRAVAWLVGLDRSSWSDITFVLSQRRTSRLYLLRSATHVALVSRLAEMQAASWRDVMKHVSDVRGAQRLSVGDLVVYSDSNLLRSLRSATYVALVDYWKRLEQCCVRGRLNVALECAVFSMNMTARCGLGRSARSGRSCIANATIFLSADVHFVARLQSRLA